MPMPLSPRKSQVMDTAQLELDANDALAGVNAEIQKLRNERRDINVALAELDIERRRLRRVANSFKPRTRKAPSNGESK